MYEEVEEGEEGAAPTASIMRASPPFVVPAAAGTSRGGGVAQKNGPVYGGCRREQGAEALLPHYLGPLWNMMPCRREGVDREEGGDGGQAAVAPVAPGLVGFVSAPTFIIRIEPCIQSAGMPYCVYAWHTGRGRDLLLPLA